jgi:aryl-alcohol dehydrogenase-like predicted oxidoreductase
MKIKQLGRTGLRVTEVCLGTMTFGGQADEATAFAIMDAADRAGISFFDTADVYPMGAAPDEVGNTERIVGKWLKERGARERIVLATKCRGRTGPHPNDEGLSRKHIMRACEDSLRRLQTDYIDLYQAHEDDPSTPLEETLSTFAELISAGKVRVIGASNYPAPRLKAALEASERLRIPRYESLQPHYNLAERRKFEGDLEQLCLDEGLGVISYYSLASGFLTGKYRSEVDLGKSARGAGAKKYLNARGQQLLATLDAVAKRHHATPAQVALAWLIARPSITAPIVSATNVEQLREILAAADLRLDPQDVASLDPVNAAA